MFCINIIIAFMYLELHVWCAIEVRYATNEVDYWFMNKEKYRYTLMAPCMLQDLCL